MAARIYPLRKLPQLRGRPCRRQALAAMAANAGAACQWQADVAVWRNRVIAGALDALAQSVKLAAGEAPAEWLQAVARADAVNRAAMSTPAPADLLAGSRRCFAQLAHGAAAWTHWWTTAAAGWADEWRQRLRLRA
jgi:hypothetical protein